MGRIAKALGATAIILALGACTPAGQGGDANSTTETASMETARHDAATFHETTSFGMASGGGHAFSATDGRILISSDETGVFNAYAVDPATGDREQLTESTTNATYAVSWFPEDNRLLVTADGGGDELSHIYLREEDGRLVDLTPGDNVRAMFLGWSPDGNDMWVATNERDAASFDIYEIDTVAFEAGVVFQNDDSLQIGSVSPDGRWLSLVRNRTSADSCVASQKRNSKPLLQNCNNRMNTE